MRPKVITFTTQLTRKCLLLEMVLEREFLSKGTSGSKVLLEEVREPHGDVPTSQEEHMFGSTKSRRTYTCGT